MQVLNERQLDIWFTGRTVFGTGAVERVGAVVGELGIRRAFAVTDPGVAASGVLDPVRRSLEAAGLDVAEYTAVTPNPAISDIEAGSAALRDFGMEDTVVVAVGGGSSMDAAKGISLHATNPGSALDLDYRNAGTGPVCRSWPCRPRPGPARRPTDSA